MTRTNEPTKVPALPAIPADTPPALRRYLELLEQVTNIRLGRRGDPRDRAITLRELISSGLAKELKEKPFDTNSAGTVGFVPAGETLVDLAVPPAPTGFSVTGAFSIINMSWNLANYANHSHTEVHVHTSDSIGDATLLGITASRVFSDPVGSGQTRYYWVRHVNTEGIQGPFNSASGTIGQTAVDVTHMLNLLNGAITSSQLATSLATPIGNLPADTQQSITNAQTTLQNNIDAIFTEVAVHSTSRAYAVGEIVRAGATDTKLYICIQAVSANSGTALTNTSFWKLYGDYDSLKTSTDTSAAAITQINNLSSNTTSAAAQAIRGLRSDLYTNGDPSQGVLLATSAAVSQLETEVFGATGGSINASASRIDGLVSEVFNPNGSSRLATASALTDLETEVIGSGSASSSRIDALDAILFDNSGNAVVSATNLSTMKSGVLNTDGTLRASATQMDFLSADYTDPVSGNNTSSLKQVLETSASSVTGLRASFAVKVDLNGAVAGFGLASTSNAAGNITSEFIVNADRFALMRGGSDNTAAVTPFTVQATQTTLNGETVPAGVYMTDAFIKNGSIESAKIKDLAVDKITGTFAEFLSVVTGDLDANRINLDNTTLTSVTIDGVPTLQVNSINANKIGSGTIDAGVITVTNLDADEITGDVNVFQAVNSSTSVTLTNANQYYEILDVTLPAPAISHRPICSVVMQATKSESGGTEVGMKITMQATAGTSNVSLGTVQSRSSTTNFGVTFYTITFSGDVTSSATAGSTIFNASNSSQTGTVTSVSYSSAVTTVQYLGNTFFAIGTSISVSGTNSNETVVFEGGQDQNFSNGQISQAAAGSFSQAITTSVRVRVYAKKEGKTVVVNKVQGFLGGIR